VAVVIAFYAVAVAVTKFITTVCIVAAAGARHTKPAIADPRGALAGGETFNALAFGHITKATGAICITGTGGAFHTGIGVGVANQALSAVAVDQAWDALAGSYVASA